MGLIPPAFPHRQSTCKIKKPDAHRPAFSSLTRREQHRHCFPPARLVSFSHALPSTLVQLLVACRPSAAGLGVGNM